MNWRGRPLASHDVIVSAIAATTTRTGLTVRAELDPGSYPEGVKVSDGQMDALPLDRHDWHGEWNYTLRPEPLGAGGPAAAAGPRTGTAGLGAPGTDGHGRRRLGPDDQRPRGSLPGPARRRALHPPGRAAHPQPAERHPAALTLSEQALVTVLRQRFGIPRRVLAELFGVVTGTIAKAERQAQPLLAQYGIQIEPATAPIKTLDDLTAYGTAHEIDLTPKIKPAR